MLAREKFSYRQDPSVPHFPDDKPIIVFDGMCAICSAWAKFVLRNDKKQQFRLLPAQTETGKALYDHYGLDHTDYETNLLIENGGVWVKSEGTIRMFERLGLPWSLMTVARILPLRLRDWLYEILARNRLRWFGIRETCLLTLPDHEGRFLG